MYRVVMIEHGQMKGKSQQALLEAAANIVFVENLRQSFIFHQHVSDQVQE